MRPDHHHNAGTDSICFAYVCSPTYHQEHWMGRLYHDRSHCKIFALIIRLWPFAHITRGLPCRAGVRHRGISLRIHSHKTWHRHTQSLSHSSWGNRGGQMVDTDDHPQRFDNHDGQNLNLSLYAAHCQQDHDISLFLSVHHYRNRRDRDPDRP